MSTTVFLEVTLAPGAARVDEIIRTTLAQTRAFAGNEGLEVLIDAADPLQRVVVERWATTAHHTAYAAWRRTPEGASELGTILAAAPVTRVFDATVTL